MFIALTSPKSRVTVVSVSHKFSSHNLLLTVVPSVLASHESLDVRTNQSKAECNTDQQRTNNNLLLFNCSGIL